MTDHRTPPHESLTPDPADTFIPSAEKGTSLGADAWRRLKKNKLAIVGAVFVVIMVLGCNIEYVTFGLIETDAQTTNLPNAHQPPSWDEPFGTDNLGRSYLARVLEGGRVSLMVGLIATIVSVIIGTFYGAIAGYYGGKLDEIMMRIVDFLYGIPYMFLVILVMIMFSDTARGSAAPVFLALGVVQWLMTARIVRGQVLTLRHQEFVQAARVMGAGDLRIIFRHILPNTLGVVIVYATLTVPAVIILESFLSFLGLGVELSWGLLVSEGVGVVNPIHSYWWLLFFPSLFLAITLFSLNFFGDGLRDAFDPRTRK
ncbi:MAG: ABC transporter permease [Planctomycetota bacterium]|nr:ABC transporter permease [Planctomycetota bacterium]